VAAAIVLAQAGHAVCMVTPDEPAGTSLAESIPPSAHAILADLGVLDPVVRAGFIPNRGNTVRWAGAPVRREAFPEGAHGYHVDRGGLEAVLQRTLPRQGVRLARGLTAREARREAALWHVRAVDRAGDSLRVTAPWVIDATGRRGFFAHGFGRVTDRKTTTVALMGRRARDPNTRDDGHTIIESHDQGWTWSVPVEPGVRCVTAMIDPEHTPLEGAPVDAILRSELRKTPLVDDAAGGWGDLIGTWACPASLYTSHRYADDGVLLAGDAGSFIDPLSSYGVKKALASGRLAGIVVSTALRDPSLAGQASSFHDAYERSVAARYRAHSSAYFEDAWAWHGHEFWSERAAAARAAAEAVGIPGDPTAPGGADLQAPGPPRDLDAPLPTSTVCDVTEPAARRAFDQIRSAECLNARAGATLRRVRAAALEGRRIVIVEHLASDRHPRPVRYHRSVDLLRLATLAPTQGGVPDLWAAYNRSGPPADLPDFLTALAVACAAGFLDLGDPA
jgi:flavin-dependent dehydrogenase